MSTESLIEEFETLLGNKPYFTAKQLIELNIFGSQSAAIAALNRGTLPSIQISSKRRVIPRSAVIQYFRHNLMETSLKG